MISAAKTDADVLHSQCMGSAGERGGIAVCGRLRHSASDRSVYMLILLTKPQRTAADALLHI